MTAVGTGRRRRSALLLAAAVGLIGACASAAPSPPAQPLAVAAADVFESKDYIVALAKRGDTAESLALRHLGDAGKAWLIEDYTGARSFSEGQEVVIPKRDWNPAGVGPSGYQLVPVLVYHNMGPEQKGRMLIAASRFEEQMRYLKAEGYRVVNLREFLDYTNLRRQLPKKSVLLAFDDGYKAFRQYAYPVLKELGFTATLFVYTDYVGAGRNALSWPELRELVAEGFDVQAHSKTHGDLRRSPGETDPQYAKRMQVELAQPLALFRQHLGRSSTILAYPYGYWDEDLIRQLKEHGYVAGFTVRRQANPAFVFPFRINRSQVYGEMRLEDFAKNLNLFHDEDLR